MVEAEELASELAGPLLGLAVVVGADQEAPSRPFFGGVRQRVRSRDETIAADQRAAAFVGIGFDAVRPDGGGDSVLQRQRHQRVLLSLVRPSPPPSQNRSDRYFSPPSQKTTTTTSGGSETVRLPDAARATCSAP